MSKYTSKEKNKDVEYVELTISPQVVVVAVVAVLAIVGLMVWFTRKPAVNVSQQQTTANAEQTTKDNNVYASANIGKSPVLGKDDAPVTIFEFSDMECPFCRAFYFGYGDRIIAAWPELKKNYIDTGKVKYVSKTFVAVSSHNPSAQLEARAGYCANKQGKYFEYFHELFEGAGKGGKGYNGKGAAGQDELSSALVALAGKLGMNKTEFSKCLKSEESLGFYNADEKLIGEMMNEMQNDPDYDGAGTPLFVICKTPKDDDTKCTGKVIMGAYPYSEFKSIIDPLLENK